MPSRRQLPTVPHPDAPTLPAAVRSAVGFLVNEVAAHFRHAVERVLAEHSLRRSQYLMLLVLRDDGPMSQMALGQRLGVDRTTTMRLVQMMEESGQVDRKDDPADRRVYRVALTTRGRRLTTTLERRIRRAEQELLAPLAAAEQDRFAAQLQAILHAQEQT